MARAADWSALPSELVSRVADVFLATSDVDYYGSLRAVCRNWRAATDDPRWPDPRFRPHRWVMLDELDRNAGSRLFLNVETGRFLGRDLPALRYYFYVAAADGLLVLLESSSESRLCVVNPITGSVVRFRATVHVHPRDIGLAVAGSSPMVLTIFSSPSHGACFEPTVPGVNPSSPPVFTAAPTLDGFASVVAFQGCVYAADSVGSVAVVEYTGPDTTPEITVLVAGDGLANTYTFLIDSAGDELLLVRASSTSATGRSIQVFKVNLVTNALEPVRSIGNRALVLGVQCVSVDAGNVPGLEGNCVYYGNGQFRETGVCVYRMDDGSEEALASHPTDEERRRGQGRVFPLPLAQVLVISAWPFRDSDFEGW